jgi:predicted solute-binding protein
VILARKYGVFPALSRHSPDLDAMLRGADAALIIGDPALRIAPERLPYYVYDLGAEWVDLTGLPMVFAVWAGRREAVTAELAEVFRDSYSYGRERIDEIVAQEAARREFAPEMVREYLTRHIVHSLGAREYEGMQLFLEYARQLAGASATRGR